MRQFWSHSHRHSVLPSSRIHARPHCSGADRNASAMQYVTIWQTWEPPRGWILAEVVCYNDRMDVNESQQNGFYCTYSLPTCAFYSYFHELAIGFLLWPIVRQNVFKNADHDPRRRSTLISDRKLPRSVSSVLWRVGHEVHLKNATWIVGKGTNIYLLEFFGSFQWFWTGCTPRRVLTEAGT